MKILITILISLSFLACSPEKDGYSEEVENYTIRNNGLDTLTMVSFGRKDTTTYTDTLLPNKEYFLFEYKFIMALPEVVPVTLHSDDVESISIYSSVDSLLYEWKGEGESYFAISHNGDNFFKIDKKQGDTTFYLLEIE